MPDPRRAPVLLAPMHEPAPHFADKPLADLSLEVEVDGWDYYVECRIDAAPVVGYPGETRPVLREITYTALLWMTGRDLTRVREVPFVAAGRLRREIEREVEASLE